MPRAFRSASRPAIGLSDAAQYLVWFPSRSLWASQPLPAPQYSSTNRTPRSTSLRAIRQLVPKTELAGLSMPYIFSVASDSLERSTASDAADCIW